MAEAKRRFYWPLESRCDMRHEVVTATRYSLRSGHEACFCLTYEVVEGPRPGMERWFLVRMEEISELKLAA